MMVEKRIGSLIRMDVESETKSCSSLLWDELDLLNYAIVVLYCTISRCVCSPQSKTRDMSVSRVYADVVEKMPPDYSDYEAVTIDWMSCCSVFHDDLGVQNASRLFERLERGNTVKYSRESTWKQMNRWESNISNQYDPRKY